MHVEKPLTAEPSCKDEARVGQKGRTCHRWWLKGHRPPGLCDRRFTWTYLFAAVEPATGRSAALVLPEVSTEAMTLFLERFAATLAADEHAVLVLDQAGWHGAKALAVPDTITLVPLPPYSPELNPIERIWLSLRERFLSHRMLDDYDAILDACCAAWKRMTPPRLRSLCNLHPTGQNLSAAVLLGRGTDEAEPRGSADCPGLRQPLVKRQRNDATDAEAICEAAQRPTMRCVVVESEDKQPRRRCFMRAICWADSESSSSMRCGAPRRPRDRGQAARRTRPATCEPLDLPTSQHGESDHPSRTGTINQIGRNLL